MSLITTMSYDEIKDTADLQKELITCMAQRAHKHTLTKTFEIEIVALSFTVANIMKSRGIKQSSQALFLTEFLGMIETIYGQIKDAPGGYFEYVAGKKVSEGYFN